MEGEGDVLEGVPPLSFYLWCTKSYILTFLHQTQQMLVFFGCKIGVRLFLHQPTSKGIRWHQVQIIRSSVTSRLTRGVCPKKRHTSSEPTCVVLIQHQPGISVFQICSSLTWESKLYTFVYQKTFKCPFVRRQPHDRFANQTDYKPTYPPVYQSVSFCISR